VEAEPDVLERLEGWRRRLASDALHLIQEASGRLSRGMDVLMPPPGWEMTSRPFAFATDSATTFQGSDPDGVATSEPDAPTIRVVRRGLGIEVQVEPMDVGEASRLVALVPTREGERAEVKLLHPSREKPRTWIARFQVDGDDFVVVLEPGS
jgi:hypothetical protein